MEGIKIKAARLVPPKVSQKQLAESLGVSQALVCRWEKGKPISHRRLIEVLAVIKALRRYFRQIRSAVSSKLPLLREVGERAVEQARRGEIGAT